MTHGEFAPLDTQRMRSENFMRVSRHGMVLAIVMHTVFAVFGWFLAPILFYLQIASIAAYSLSYFLSFKGHVRTIHAIVVTDLLVHSTVASWIVGPDAGFQYYSWILLPLTFVNIEFTQRSRLQRAMFLCVLFLIIDWTLRHTTPLVAVSEHGIEAMRFFNILCFLTATTSSASQYTMATAKAEAKLRSAAETDVLTGLLNRRRMTDRMLQAWERANAEHRPMAVMLLDIDYFKSINDRFGHSAGDDVIARIGQVLQKTVRRDDLVARWGGEEFLILLPDAALSVANEISERIRAEIARTSFSDSGLRVTATIGLAAWQEGETLDATIHRADTLLYQGKHQGRNRVVYGTCEDDVPHQLAS